MAFQDLPAGFALDPAPPPVKPSVHLPEGFEVDEPVNSAPQAPARQGSVAPTGQAHDGDTYRTAGGVNARMLGYDAFELDQAGRGASGASLALGQDARDQFKARLPGATASATGEQTYGRPVVALTSPGGEDVGEQMIAAGSGVPVPQYLAGDPKRLSDYIEAQRDAIASERGAYAGQYQAPDEYRKRGEAAPWRGKIVMNLTQAGEWDRLMRDPKTKPTEVGKWLRAQGHSAENVTNLVRFLSRNPNAKANPAFQQEDAQGQPVQAEPRGMLARSVDALNEGVIDFVATPFEVSHMIAQPVANTFGLDIGGSSPIGSWLRDRWHDLGLGQRDEGSAPRSNVERYAQAFLRGTGSAILPVGGTLAAGGRLATRAPSIASEASAARSAVRGSLVDAASDPRTAIALEVGSGAGSYIGEEAAYDVAPGNPYAAMAGQVIGGLSGGFAAGRASAAGRRAPRAESAPERPTGEVEAEPAAPTTDPTIERDGKVFARAADGAEVAIPTDASGHPGAIWADDHWEALVGVDDGAPSYGPQTGKGSLPSAYRELVQRLNGDAAPAPSREAPRFFDPEGEGLPPSRREPRAKVEANAPTVDEESALGPKSVLSFVPHKGPPGVSVVNEEGLATAVFRDSEGIARGAVQIPTNAEARASFDAVSSYVEPAYRRQGVATALYDALRKDGHPIEELSGSADLTPDGAAFVNARRAAAMTDEAQPATLEAPVDSSTEVPPTPRERDVIDVTDRPRRLLDDASDEERRRVAERVAPADLLPVPSSRVADVEEAAAIERGRYAPARGPDETGELSSRTIQTANGGLVRKRGPLDLVGFLRTQGGIHPHGGELAHRGITNEPRKGMDFAGGEQRLGKLVDADGLAYDDAAHAAWEAGYFPDHAEPPSIAEFLDALDDTHTGRNRTYHPDDFAEVERYEAARSQRYSVEAARDQGAPLTSDRAEPATLEDLERNAAPVEAYEEWGENAPDFAGNIRLENLDSPQQIKRALVQVERTSGGFDAATRGRIRQAETERLAAELNMTADDLLSRRKGQALNAEQALAARQILAKSGNELVNLARRTQARIQAGEASEAELAAFRQSVMRHAAIQEQVAGATAEAGRALAQFKMTASSRAVRGEVLRSLVEGAGGSSGIADAASAILDNAADPKRVNAIAAALAKPRLKDKAVELWYNFLLSGPRTHAVNILSNTMTSLAQLPEHAAAAAIGAPRAMLARGAADRVMLSEVGARAVGMMNGAREGFLQAGRTMRTGQVSDFVTKVEAQEQHAIGGVMGSVLRTPTRMLSAEDEFFKAVARRQEIAGLAVRTARAEGLRGPAARTRAAELTANPTPEMMERAFDFGRYVTFQRPLGPGGQAVLNLTNRIPGLKLFLPFVRTPTNLVKFAAERSPAAPALAEWRADFKAGGARRDLAIARASVGTGAIMLALEAAKQGLVSGNGPADESARRLLMADGWQPYSLKVGDTYYSYQRLDPFSTTIGLAADYVDLQSQMTEKQRQQVASLLLGSTLQNLSEKTWFSGMARLTQALHDPARYGEQLVTGTASSILVPALFSQTAQAMDPMQRDAQSIIDRIRSRVPGASRALPPRRDVLGRPVPGGNGGGLSAFSPMFTSTAQNDATIRAIGEAGVHIGRPSRTYDGGKSELTPQQYSDFQELAGAFAKPELDAIVREPRWLEMDTDERQARVTKIMTAARKAAREEVLNPAALPEGFTVDR